VRRNLNHEFLLQNACTFLSDTSSTHDGGAAVGCITPTLTKPAVGGVWGDEAITRFFNFEWAMFKALDISRVEW
jgi:hypothetical protein